MVKGLAQIRGYSSPINHMINTADSPRGESHEDSGEIPGSWVGSDGRRLNRRRRETDRDNGSIGRHPPRLSVEQPVLSVGFRAWHGSSSEPAEDSCFNM